MFNKIKSILVSGAGGDIGQGIGRLLFDLGFEKVFGCDVYTDHVGRCIFTKVVTVPYAVDNNYIPSLQKLIELHEIDLFIPTSEAELLVLNKVSNIEDVLACKVLKADEKTIDIALNKFDTVEFLKQNSIQYPWTVLTERDLPLDVPCIFKPCSGQGSKGLEKVDTFDRASQLIGTKGYIFQQLLGTEDDEYTCGVFRSKSGAVRSIILKRKLSNGYTGQGIVVEDPAIERYVVKIANSLNVTGSVNLQLRNTSCGPVLFEINPRFSSTVVFRAKLGFEDMLWSIQDLLDIPLSDYTPPKEGVRFYRGLTEYIDYGY